MASNQVKIALITGYLGAGKTTLLNHILANTDGIRAAVIVNDIGEVNIDADLIASTGAVTQVDDSLIPMTNGCICCSLSDDLANQLRGIANSGDFDYIIIEASGVCEPMPIAFTISQFCENTEQGDAPMDLDNVIAVVDCARMFDEFNGGKALLDENAEDDSIVSLLIDQIEFCSTLVLNKADQVTPEQLEELHALVRGLQKDAVILEAVKGDIDLKALLNTGLFTFESAYDSAVWVEALEHPEEANRAHDEYEKAHEHHHHHHHDHDHDHDDHDEDCDCDECRHHHHDDDDDEDEHEHHHGHGHHHHHHDHDDHDEDCDCDECRHHHHDDDDDEDEHEHHHHHDHDDDEHEHHHGHGHHHHHHHDHDHGDHDHVAEFGITTFVYERRAAVSTPKMKENIDNWPESIIRCKGMMWRSEDPDMCYVFEQAGKRFYMSENGLWAAAASEEEKAEIFERFPKVLEDWDLECGDRRTKLVVIGRNMKRAEIEAFFDSCLA